MNLKEIQNRWLFAKKLPSWARDACRRRIIRDGYGHVELIMLLRAVQIEINPMDIANIEKEIAVGIMYVDEIVMHYV